MVKSSSDQNNPPTDYDVAIIGGGISGVYAAWRVAEVGLKSPHLQTLAQERQDGRLRIAVFETSDRIGGRLFSSSFSGDPGPPIELGGMRFLTSHVRVHGLVNTKLGLPTRKLAVNDPNGKNLSYLRGRHFTAADWGRLSFVPPYLLDRSERARSPGNLLIEVALRHLGGTLEALQAVGYHSEALESLRNIGFRNLMLKEMSAEAYELIRDACGYDTLVNNWGAAEAIPFLLADFDPRLEYFALNDGFQSLPKKLAKLFDDVGPTTSLHMRHRLFRIDQTQNGELQLTFQTDADPTGGSTGRRIPDAQKIVRTARHVILAMPRRAIELLHPDSVVFDSPQFATDLEAVLPQPAFKIFAAFRRPWWLDDARLGIQAGRSVTDLPVRQCYYWSTAQPAPANDPHAPRASTLMASYNDGGSVEFWQGLSRDAARYHPPVSACPPGVPILDPTRPEDASAALATELQTQLRELHGLSTLTNPDASDIIPPYAVKFRDWTADPFGGGWHFWKIGVNAKEIGQRMRRPSPNANVYVCGEAWSRQQGWVEGALETTDDLLENILALPRPDWLP